MADEKDIIRETFDKKYEYGFTTDVETEIIPTGLNEDVIRLISHKKQEPEWLLEFRLRAFQYWQTLAQPEWGHVNLPAIDYQAILCRPLKEKVGQERDRSGVDEDLRQTGHSA